MFQRSTILNGNHKLWLITLSVIPFSNLIILYLGFFIRNFWIYAEEKMEETVRI